jgi:hypothetical protein
VQVEESKFTAGIQVRSLIDETLHSVQSDIFIFVILIAISIPLGTQNGVEGRISKTEVVGLLVLDRIPTPPLATGMLRGPKGSRAESTKSWSLAAE